MSLAITIPYAAANGIFCIALAFNVSRLRAKTNTFLGTAESEELLRAARRHANNAEYVPLGMLMLMIAETAGGAATPLHAMAGVFTVGRLMHSVGIDAKPNAMRGLGALFGWVTIIALAVYALMLWRRG